MDAIIKEYLDGSTQRQLIKKYKGIHTSTFIKSLIKNSGHSRKAGQSLKTGKTKTAKCKYCHKDFKSNKSMASHAKWCTKGPHRKKTIENQCKDNSHLQNALIKERLVECEYCGLEFNSIAAVNGHKIGCLDNPNRILRGSHSGWKHSDSAKKKISDARKKLLSEDPSKGINHYGPSKPEIHLINKLESWGWNIIPQYSDKRWKRGFKIDIYLPDHEVGLEVNGQFKYKKDGSLKKYYCDRSNIIESTSGIKILDIHYLQVFKIDEEKLIKLVSTL